MMSVAIKRKICEIVVGRWGMRWECFGDVGRPETPGDSGFENANDDHARTNGREYCQHSGSEKAPHVSCQILRVAADFCSTELALIPRSSFRAAAGWVCRAMIIGRGDLRNAAACAAC